MKFLTKKNHQPEQITLPEQITGIMEELDNEVNAIDAKISVLVISVTLLTISALMVLPNRDNHFKKFFSDNKAISTALSDCKKNGGHSVPIGSMKTIRLSPSMNRPMIEAVPDEDRTTYDVTETAEHEDGKYYIKVAYTVADDQNKATMGH